MRTILQIIPCSVQLYARYRQDVVSNTEYTSPVIGFALMEDHHESGRNYQYVAALACEGKQIGLVEAANFLGFTDHPIP